MAFEWHSNIWKDNDIHPGYVSKPRIAWHQGHSMAWRAGWTQITPTLSWTIYFKTQVHWTNHHRCSSSLLPINSFLRLPRESRICHCFHLIGWQKTGQAPQFDLGPAHLVQHWSQHWGSDCDQHSLPEPSRGPHTTSALPQLFHNVLFTFGSHISCMNVGHCKDRASANCEISA